MIEAYGISVKGHDHAENEDAFLIDRHRKVFAVADGVTLPYGGRDASNKAIELVQKFLIPNRLEESLEKINEVFAKEREEGNLVGFTTLTVLVIRGRKAVVANIGDSPAYLIRGNVVREIYTNHRTPLGIKAMDGHTEFSINEAEISPGDIIMLCTDGVSDYLSKKELLSLVEKHKNLEILAKEIISYVQAKEQPYNDDKTVVLVRIWE